jgi:hypothetical protein
LWTRESTNEIIKKKYGVSFQKGGLSKFLQSQNLTLENYYFPKICKSLEIRDWFSNGKLAEIKNVLPAKYELFWAGTKNVEGKLNMIYLVSIQGKMYWSLINGIVTPKRQLTFMARARKEMKPIKPVLLRTQKGFFQFNDKYRYTNINKVYPSRGVNFAALPQRHPADLDLHGLCRSESSATLSATTPQKSATHPPPNQQ